MAILQDLKDLLGGTRFKIADYAAEKDQVYVLTPRVFYPAMVQRIQVELSEEGLPGELIDKKINPEIDPTMAARRYKRWAGRIATAAWADALVPLAALPQEDEQRIEDRAEALECARLWFTRALKNKVSPAPVRIKILRDDDYKLGTNKAFSAG